MLKNKASFYVKSPEDASKVLDTIRKRFPGVKWNSGHELDEYDALSSEYPCWFNVWDDCTLTYGSKIEPVQCEHDPVNHPDHYTSGSIECIDAMIETQGTEAVQHFCVCNAFKYLWRWRGKNGMEDIKKAAWYLNKAITLQEREDK